jgi:hypothetical protein
VHEHVQRLVSVVKTATVPKECITEKQLSVVSWFLFFLFFFVFFFFLGWAKQLNAKAIHKEMFPLYGEKCLSPLGRET